MNQHQKKNITSQGLPVYKNSVKTDDPKYQVRVFNGKPQFRIRKRNDSAKIHNMISRANSKNKPKNSLKNINIVDDQAVNAEYPSETAGVLKKSLKDISNHRLINKLQAKYGINPVIPPGSKHRNRKPPHGAHNNLQPLNLKKYILLHKFS